MFSQLEDDRITRPAANTDWFVIGPPMSSNTTYVWVADPTFPSASVPVTVNACEPGSFGTIAPSATGPWQETTPEPPASSVQK